MGCPYSIACPVQNIGALMQYTYFFLTYILLQQLPTNMYGQETALTLDDKVNQLEATPQAVHTSTQSFTQFVHSRYIE
jgi:hypothetical protein